MFGPEVQSQDSRIVIETEKKPSSRRFSVVTRGSHQGLVVSSEVQRSSRKICFFPTLKQ